MNRAHHTDGRVAVPVVLSERVRTDGRVVVAVGVVKERIRTDGRVGDARWYCSIQRLPTSGRVCVAADVAIQEHSDASGRVFAADRVAKKRCRPMAVFCVPSPVV